MVPKRDDAAGTDVWQRDADSYQSIVGNSDDHVTTVLQRDNAARLRRQRLLAMSELAARSCPAAAIPEIRHIPRRRRGAEI